MAQKNKNILAFALLVAFAILSIILFIQNSGVGFRGDQSKDPGDTSHEIKSAPVALYAPTIDYEQAVINAVDAGLKSVVSIVISKDVPVLERCPYNPFGNLGPEFDQFFGNNFNQFYTQCPSGKNTKQEIGGGSGFIVSEDGLILTNKHVVTDEKADYTVIMNDGKKYPAKVLARDPSQDIAILKVDKIGLTPAKLGDSSSIKLGQTAIAIGNALAEFKNTVSVGIVSGLSRSIVASGGSFSENIDGLIQTDAAINPGNSGGPLLNLKGEVIGINVAIAQGAQNIGFTIPINQAKRAIASVKKTGSIKTAYIGVRYVMITADMAKDQNLTSEQGALVRGDKDGPAIVPNSPADKAGLKAEDIILEVDGIKLEDGTTLANVIQRYNIDDAVTLKVKRGEQTLDIRVVLEERPAK